MRLLGLCLHTPARASNDCVECRADQARVHIRDTRHREQGSLAFPAPEWRAFLVALKDARL